jgi:hypothetical protein
MRTAIVVGLVLAGVASVAAQEYQSPVAPLPPTVSKPLDTSSATRVQVKGARPRAYVRASWSLRYNVALSNRGAVRPACGTAVS